MLNLFFERVGRFVIRWLQYIGEVMMLLGETLRQLKKPPRMRHVFSQMAHLGADSLPIVGLTLLFTGMVMTLITTGATFVKHSLRAKRKRA